MRSRRTVRRVGAWLAAVLCTAAAPPAHAGAQDLARVSLDSVSAVDLFRGDGTTGNPDASVDISSVVRVGGGWAVHLRPWFFKSSAEGSEWNKEIYQAAVQYERPGPIALRLDAGYIASPIGLGMLEMRADMNPTIQPHMSYFVPLLPFDRSAPRVGAIAASYPLGANVTVSTIRWDARMAVVNSAPTRRYVLGAEYGTNPDPTPVVIAGGGITPITGLRFGASFASGLYATAAEVSDPTAAPRELRIWTAEGEYAFGYTRLSAEFTRSEFQRDTARDVASTWFVQGVQTLTPRWFAAGRVESILAPALPSAAPGTSSRLTYTTVEGSLAYRVTPELILRGSFTTRQAYSAATADRRVGVQLVWSRRWL